MFVRTILDMSIQVFCMDSACAFLQVVLLVHICHGSAAFQHLHRYRTQVNVHFV